jgi:hypothetical protein
VSAPVGWSPGAGGGGWRSWLLVGCAAVVVSVLAGVLVWRLGHPVPDRLCPARPVVMRPVPPPVVVFSVGGVG